MASFEERVVSTAPAEEGFKLLRDASRYPEWWAGMDRVEVAGGEVTRFMSEWPDFAYPTRVSASREHGRVTISCLLSDIAHEWRLEPHPDGCVILVRVEIPEAEAHRLEAQRAEVTASLHRLIDVAARC